MPTMRVFLYEYATGGGFWKHSGEGLAGSLLTEGRAMIEAVAADFGALPGVEVVTTRDARLPEFHSAGCRVTIIGCDDELETVRRLAATADWTLLIAPET